MELKRSKIHIEILRLIAIFLVIYNHTRIYGFTLYLNTDALLPHYLSYAFSVLCKIGVPVFFMISGALLIPKEESIKDLFRKRILRIILVILIFTALQYLRICIANHETFNFKTYITFCYCGNIIEPYWYLKAYLGYLLVLPFLRLIGKALDAEKGKYLMWLGVAKMAVEVFAIFSGYRMNVDFVICTDILFYPLLGHAIENIGLGEKLRKAAVPAIVGIVVLTVIGGEVYKSVNGVYSDMFVTVSAFPLAMFTYIAVKGIKVENEKAGRVLASLGSCVFGVYLIEDVTRNLFMFRLGWNFNVQLRFASALLFCLTTMVLSLAIIWVVKKIPLVNKLI